MKVISVRQPWAELIFQNKKTIEIRKLYTSYRGPLLIHAALIRGAAEFKKASIDTSLKKTYAQQALVGVVYLRDIVRLTSVNWEEMRDKHLLPGKWLSEDYKFAWILENPKRITPIHFLGKPSMFSVDEEMTNKILKMV